MHTGMSKEEVLRLVESDIDGLPSKYPSDPERKGIKMPPEYLGKSGNFYTKHDNHVRMIGECVAVARDPSDGNPCLLLRHQPQVVAALRASQGSSLTRRQVMTDLPFWFTVDILWVWEYRSHFVWWLFVFHEQPIP
jgi:hypothetical protein